MLQSFESFAGRYGFAKVAPLLADVAAVEEGGLVSVTATPDKMEVPSERMTVRVEPLRSLQPTSLPSKGVPDGSCLADPPLLKTLSIALPLLPGNSLVPWLEVQSHALCSQADLANALLRRR